MVRNESLVFLQVPTDEPVPGQHLDKRTEELDVDNVPLNGGVLVKVDAISLDPYMREHKDTSWSTADHVLICALSLINDCLGVALNFGGLLGNRMRPAEKAHYSAAYPIGKPVTAFGIGKILRSDAPAFPVGKLLYGQYWASEYAVIEPDMLSRCIIMDNKENLPSTTIVGAAGECQRYSASAPGLAFSLLGSARALADISGFSSPSKACRVKRRT